MKHLLNLIFISYLCINTYAQPLTMDFDGDFKVNHKDAITLMQNKDDSDFNTNDVYQLSHEWQRTSNQRINPETGLLEVRITLFDTENQAVNIDFVEIKAGTYTIGAPDSEHQLFSVPSLRQVEWRPHQVTISQNFFIAKYETTQAQWIALMGNNPSTYKDRPQNPIDQVSWDDSQAFITKLNQLGLGTFRLPTEAEWEYACRAGTQTAYYHTTGENCLFSSLRCAEHEDYMWYVGNTSGSLAVGHRPVGTKLPNPWGLYDMHGNVFEWCQDFWQDPFDRGPVTDPGIFAPNDRGPILRSGGWNSLTFLCRSANRNYDSPEMKFNNTGFRIVATSLVGIE